MAALINNNWHWTWYRCNKDQVPMKYLNIPWPMMSGTGQHLKYTIEFRVTLFFLSLLLCGEVKVSLLNRAAHTTFC